MSTPYEIAAYYFPSYHADPRNEQWHGKGWTEWDLIKAARPRYDHHAQPKIPAWGYFDESDPQWTAREIELAADHGITSFLYDWYWYDDAPYLHGALEQGFLRAPNRNRMKFALMWANHDWNNMFPARLTNRPDILARGRVTADVFEHICEVVIDRYFSQPNYLRLAGQCYFSIYELGTFINGVGGVDAACRLLERFRRRAEAAGVGVHLNTVVWQLAILPGELKLGNVNDIIRRLGIDSATTYAWVHHYDPSAAGFPCGSYAEAAEVNYAAWERYARELPVPYHPNVSMGWDPSPRTCQSDRFENRGYPWTAVLEGNTPEAFGQALCQAKAFIDAKASNPKMLTLNAWNEWTEGSYLLPDTTHGTAYLQAIKDTFGNAQPPRNHALPATAYHAGEGGRNR